MNFNPSNQPPNPTQLPLSASFDFRSEDEMWDTAYHEAGHIVMSRAVGCFSLRSATIVPGGGYLGLCVGRDLRLHPGDHARGILFDMAGFAAEWLRIGEPPIVWDWVVAGSGAAVDYETAMASARVLHPRRPERYVRAMTFLAYRTLVHCRSSVERVAAALVAEKTIDDWARLFALAEGSGGRRSRLARLHDRWLAGRGRRFQIWLAATGGVQG